MISYSFADFWAVWLVLALLLTPKDAIGCSWFSILLGGVVESRDTCKIISLPWLIQLLQNLLVMQARQDGGQ